MKRMHILVFAITVFFVADVSSIPSFADTVSIDSLAWVSDSLDIDGIYDIAYQNLQGDDYLTEKSGYGPTWETYDTDLNDQSYMSRDGVYSPDGIIFEKDGTYGVMDFSGTVLIDGLAGNSCGAYNPAYDTDSSDNDPYSCTGWGISLEQDAVLGSDYTWQDYSSEIPDLMTGGDAGIEYVNQEGLLKAAIIGDPGNPPMDYKDDWAAYTAEDAIVMRINDETSQVLGSARVNADGSVAYVTDYPLYDLDDARGYVNGFYVTSFYTGDFSIAREYGQEQDSSGYGLVNAENGELITKQPYQEVKWFEDGYCPVKVNDRWAFIDEQGNEITDFIFEDASVLYDGKTFVKLDGTYRILDLKATTGDVDPEADGNEEKVTSYCDGQTMTIYSDNPESMFSIVTGSDLKENPEAIYRLSLLWGDQSGWETWLTLPSVSSEVMSGRIHSIILDGGQGQKATFHFEASDGNTIRATLEEQGAVCEYSYDDNSRIVSSHFVVDGNDTTTTYEYYNEGLGLAIGGQGWTGNIDLLDFCQFDENGYPIRIGNSDLPGALYYYLSYDESGKILSVRKTSDDGTGSEENMTELGTMEFEYDNVINNEDVKEDNNSESKEDFSTATEQSGVGWEDAYRQILESYTDSNESFYVADLDGGGIPELLLTDATSESYHGGRVEIYTFDGTDAVDLGQYGSWNSIRVIQDQGVLLDTYLWEGGVGGTSYYQIDDSEPEHIHFLFRVNQEIGEDGSFVQRMADKDGNDLPEAEDVDDVISSYSGTTVRYAVQDSLSSQDDPDAVIMMPVTKSNIIQTLGSDNDYSGQMTESTSEGDDENAGDTAAWQQAYWSFLMDTLYDLTADQDKAFCIDDMDGDGIPEIALADNNTAHYNGVTIYTLQDNQALELGGFGGNGGCEICKDKGIIRGAHSGQGASINEYCQIDHSVPEGIKLLCRVDSYTSETGTVYDLVDADGNSIQSLTEDEYNSKIQEYESVGTFTEYSVPDSDGTNGYAKYYPDWVPLYKLTYDSICDATGIYEDDNYFNEEDDPYASEENYE